MILWLHQKKKTVLLILSQYRFLKYATQILLLKEGELIQNNQEINEFIANSITKQSYNDDGGMNENNGDFLSIEKENEFFDGKINEKTDISPSSIQKSERKNTDVTEQKASELVAEGAQTDLSKNMSADSKNEEIREEGTIKFGTLMIYVTGMGLFFFTMIILTMLMMQLCRNFFDIWLKEYVNYNTLFLFEDDFKITLICIAAFAIFWALMRSFCFAVGNLRSSKNIFIQLLNNIMYSKMGFFENNAVGRIINRFSGDTYAIDDRISFESNILLNNVFILGGSLVVIILQNVYVIICNFCL